ncbi:hypothetical protein SCHPADRAFT_657314 [Schizopora paradoxa]|uniref:Uncharacterized protein n=1 Tax=Schizopora paradoxa TaxID=27342 RepID=A0A0H2R794_9AGAM|nr:hypothetical protein SCHPADRAFT_657314 [Schizopora paradoxa]
METCGVESGEDETPRVVARKLKPHLPRLAKAHFPCALEYAHEQRHAEKEPAAEGAGAVAADVAAPPEDLQVDDYPLEADDTLVNDHRAEFNGNEASTSRTVLKGLSISTPKRMTAPAQSSYMTPASLPRPAQNYAPGPSNVPSEMPGSFDDAMMGEPEAMVGPCCDAAEKLPQLEASLKTKDEAIIGLRGRVSELTATVMEVVGKGIVALRKNQDYQV